jgi:lysophospholipase L1-like esterase
MGVVIRIAQPLRATAGLAARIYERVWRDETARRGIIYAPMAAEIGPAFRADPLLLSFDGFHPSARGYALWAECFNRYIEKAWPSN